MQSVQAGDRFRWTDWEASRAVSPCQLGNRSRTELMQTTTKATSHLAALPTNFQRPTTAALLLGEA